MRQIAITKQYKKDVERLKKQGKDMLKLSDLVKKLAMDSQLSLKYRDHLLTGEWKSYRECHIEPDWLLIYEKTYDNILKLIVTGSHSDIFG